MKNRMVLVTPTGLTGEEIPIESRIATICDVFDAVTSSRPYKEREAWSVEDAKGLADKVLVF